MSSSSSKLLVVQQRAVLNHFQVSQSIYKYVHLLTQSAVFAPYICVSKANKKKRVSTRRNLIWSWNPFHVSFVICDIFQSMIAERGSTAILPLCAANWIALVYLASCYDGWSSYFFQWMVKINSRVLKLFEGCLLKL